MFISGLLQAEWDERDINTDLYLPIEVSGYKLNTENVIYISRHLRISGHLYWMLDPITCVLQISPLFSNSAFEYVNVINIFFYNTLVALFNYTQRYYDTIQVDIYSQTNINKRVVSERNFCKCQIMSNVTYVNAINDNVVCCIVQFIDNNLLNVIRSY